jgi:hypothetical protein
VNKGLQRQVEYGNFPNIDLFINGKYEKFLHCSSTEISRIKSHKQINLKVCSCLMQGPSLLLFYDKYVTKHNILVRDIKKFKTKGMLSQKSFIYPYPPVSEASSGVYQKCA